MATANAQTNNLEESYLKAVFQNTLTGALAAIGSGLQAASTAGSLYISLHTASPGETGDQTTSEASYTGYARVAVARTSGAWSVTDTGGGTWQATNVADITFGKSSSSQSITHAGIGSASSGAGNLLYYGALDSGTLAVENGLTPEIEAGALTIEAL